MGESKFFSYSIDSSVIYLIYIGFALGLLQVSDPSPPLLPLPAKIFTSFENKFLLGFFMF